MKPLESIKRWEYLNYLIKHKATGDLETLARKMGLSKSTVRDLIAQMRERGAKISYDRTRKTYYYAEQGEFYTPKFFKYGEVLTREEMTKRVNPDELCFDEKATFIPCKEI